MIGLLRRLARSLTSVDTAVPCATCVYRLSLWKIYMIELNFDYYKMQDILMSSKSPFLTLKFNFHAFLSFKDAFCNIIFCKVIDMFLVNRTSLANLELMLPPKLLKKMASSIKIFLILYWTEKLQFIQKVIVFNHTLDFHEKVLMYELLIEVSTISQSFYFFYFFIYTIVMQQADPSQVFPWQPLIPPLYNAFILYLPPQQLLQYLISHHKEFIYPIRLMIATEHHLWYSAYIHPQLIYHV